MHNDGKEFEWSTKVEELAASYSLCEKHLRELKEALGVTSYDQILPAIRAIRRHYAQNGDLLGGKHLEEQAEKLMGILGEISLDAVRNRIAEPVEILPVVIPAWARKKIDG